MTQVEKRIADFIRADSTFPYRELEKILRSLGYNEMKRSKTGGSKRKFFNANANHYLRFHEPHDGRMTRNMIKRLKQNLHDAGVL
ncbi:MAG: hypothetical protein IIB67_10120 [Proteobacteria bacterium]|nr:hypothetical protein [Pseudomonadota bacterium]